MFGSSDLTNIIIISTNSQIDILWLRSFPVFVIEFIGIAKEKFFILLVALNFVRKFVRVRKNVRNMVNVKFYLDKADKSKYFPIHLVIRQKTLQVKVSTCEKVLKEDWNAENQTVNDTDCRYKSINKFLAFLKQEANPLKELVNQISSLSRAVADELLILLRKIAARGAVPALLKADTAIGRTLETLLGLLLTHLNNPTTKALN